MTPADLASRRWFRSKQRSIAAVTEVDRAPVGPGALVVLEVTFDDDGGSERYLVPLIDGRDPEDGEGLWTALAEAVGHEGRIGSFVARRAAGFASAPGGERSLAVQQSNTSVVLGERLILKLYRLLERGENPDVEVTAFLARVGFSDTPALAGSVTYEADGSRSSAAMVQAYLAGAGDAWPRCSRRSQRMRSEASGWRSGSGT
jgi:predicted trehalose synthase